MQRLTYVVFISLAQRRWEEKTVPVMPARLCTLTSRPMTVVFGLGTRLRLRMRRKLENGVLSNGQQPQSVVNGFCRPG